MECSLCCRTLTEPYITQVFNADGTEETLQNEYRVERLAVVVYSHKDCSESRKVLTSRRKGSKQQMNPYDPLEARKAEKFVKKNFRIERRGQRFLIIMPKSDNNAI